MNSSTAYKIFIIVCAVCCSIQLYKITRVYLDYKTRTYIDISFTPQIEIPDITWCTQFLYTINWTHWLIEHRQLKPEDCSLDDNDTIAVNQIKKCFDKMGQYAFQAYVEKHFTVDRFYRTIVKSHSVINGVFFWTQFGELNGLQDLNEEIICQTKTFIRDPQVCYHVACRNKSDPNRPLYFAKNRLNMASNIGSLYQVSVLQEYFKRWEHIFIFIHSPLFLPHGFEISHTILSGVDQPSTYYLQFRRMIVNLLPAPYKSNCIQYRDSKGKLQSQAQHYEQCVNNKTLQLDPSLVFYRTLIVDPNNTKAHFVNRLRFKPKYADLLEEIHDTCRQVTLNSECRKLFYATALIGYEDLINSNATLFTIMNSVEPDLNKTTIADFPLGSYIIYIGSTLGTWFGFSMYHYFHVIYNKLKPLTFTKPKDKKNYINTLE
ncbi:uncharacterized protein LOC112538505 [Tetranychus urticae]|uniref:uncharacterized protein LOC112538505 n=1 Tax=Tetranychus urticae TaxID=32264 RepID=UPI000D649C05|nr:uncharacterized protein LOC112538505 [Tetranychus urticae]